MLQASARVSVPKTFVRMVSSLLLSHQSTLGLPVTPAALITWVGRTESSSRSTASLKRWAVNTDSRVGEILDMINMKEYAVLCGKKVRTGCRFYSQTRREFFQGQTLVAGEGLLAVRRSSHSWKR